MQEFSIDTKFVVLDGEIMLETNCISIGINCISALHVNLVQLVVADKSILRKGQEGGGVILWKQEAHQINENSRFGFT